MHLFYFIFLLLATAVHSFAGLSFVSDTIAVTVKPDDKIVSVPFEFENKTKKKITISRYDSACACISARILEPLGKMAYNPGEKGKIVVDFALGSFSGQQNKTLMLWTKDDPADKPSSILTTKITIPELLEIRPKTLIWKQSEKKKAKVIKINVHDKTPIHIKKLLGSNPNFIYELKTIKDGWQYELHVTPKSLKSSGMGVIRLTTDAKIPRYQTHQTFMVVSQG